MKLSERKFTATEKECLAIVHALRKWRHYLHGEHFLVVTDHLALRWLLSLTDPRERLARWVVDIQELDFIVEHKAGKELVVPDILSRDAVPKPLCQRCHQAIDSLRLERLVQEQEDERVATELGHMQRERVSAVAEVRAFADGPSKQELREAQHAEFGILEEAAQSDRRKFVDDEGLLRIEVGNNFVLVVPVTLTQSVLRNVHGSKLHGHYKVTRTIAKLRKRYWWQNLVPDVVAFVQNCLHCAVAEDEGPRRQAGMETVHPRRRFEHVAIDIQTITPRTEAGNIKILVMIDVFTRFVRAIPIPNEKSETVAKILLDEWIAVFGPMEKLLSDGGTNLVSKVVENLVEQLGVGRVQTYPWHPQANGTVERWNRTVAKDIASFMTTGNSDWDEHVALACLRYNTSKHTATSLTPFESMFGIEAFEAWAEVDLEGADEEPEDLSKRLARLHKKLLRRGRQARLHGKTQYDKVVRETQYQVGDRVLMWSTKLGLDEGKKIVGRWIGPYVVMKKRGRGGYELEPEVGAKKIRVHVNRLRRIGPGIVESGDPQYGVFPDNLRMFKRIERCEWRDDPHTNDKTRWFKVRIHGRRSASWTKESELPETVVKLFDIKQHESDVSDIKLKVRSSNQAGKGTNWPETVFSDDEMTSK